jgi:protocatechuate 3,4-dioxygenase beta subunit
MFFRSCPSCLSCLTIGIAVIASPASAQVGGVSGGVITRQGGQPPRDAVQSIGRSTIRGRVLSADSGTPVRRATIRLNSPELRENRLASTDADGRYEFSQLPAGRYTINASKPAYVSWVYGQTRPYTNGKPIVLADNQVADNIDIRLPRGAVVTGRVVDEFGEPVASANVRALRQQFVNGQRRLVSTSGMAQTNDIGEYRLFGLSPGQYVVSASVQAQTLVMPTTTGRLETAGERTGFAATFYPATPDAASAQRLAVGTAQTLTGIDIALVPSRLASVSGFAVDSQSRPMANGNVQLMQRGTGLAGGLSNFGGAIRPDGTFTVSNVPPGEYLVRGNAMWVPPAPGTAPGPQEFSVGYVTVNGDDVTGVRLVPIRPVSVTGRIVFDDPAAAQSIKASALRVTSQVLNVEDSFGFPSNGVPDSTVHDDFTFELKTLPSRISLRAFAPSLPGGPNGAGGWQIKSIRANGADIIDSGVDLGSQGLSGVEIEMTNRVQRLSGAVTNAKGEPIKDYAVAVFPQDRARWIASLNRYFAVLRPSDDGTFKVQTLPPGEYYAIALEAVDLSDWADPDALEGLSRLATPFALTPGDTRTLELRLSAPQ